MTKTDEEQLQLLSIFQFIVGGLTMAFGCIPLIHVTIGAILVLTGGAISVSQQNVVGAPFAMMGMFFVVIGGAVVLTFWTIGLLSIRCGFCLRKHRSWQFCQVVAGVQCLLMPFGTILGIFTIIVLQRPTVKETMQGLAPSSVQPGPMS